MSNALKALNQSMNKNRPRTLRGTANMVVKVLAYGEKTMSVEVLSGPIIGQTIDLALNPANKKIEDFSKASKAQTSSYTPVGGILRCENVSAQKDGTYLSRWTNAWIKTPNDANQLLVDQMVSYQNTGRTNKDDKPIVQLRTMDAKNEVKVTTLDEMEAQLANAFASTRAALVIDTSEGFSTATYYLPGKREGDSYVHADPKEFAAKLIEDLGLDDQAKKAFEDVLATNGLTIVPIRQITVGATTSEEIQKALDKADEAGKRARIMSVNPYAYEVPSIGIRLSGALAAKNRDDKLEIPTEYAERLKEAFLATAPEPAKAALHADGWRGVSDTDLKDFFASKGVELKDHPVQSWNTASIHMQKFDGGTNFFAAKTFETRRYGSPYPMLEVCKDLRQSFATELTDAVNAVVGAPAVKAAVEEKPKAAPLDDTLPVQDQLAEEAEKVEAGGADIDALLDDIANENMDIGD